MLTGHQTEHESERPTGSPHEDDAPRDETRRQFPVLDEPAWLEDDPEEMEEPRDSAFRGIWIGIAAAAITFVLVFAIPQWLGWYDVGTPPERARRETTPEAVISTVTAKPSAPSDAPPVAPPPAAARPAAAPPAALPKIAATSHPAPAPAPAPKSRKPAAAAVVTEPAAAKRTYSVQIAAFKTAPPAGRLAARVKHDGYPADLRRLESAAVPWVVRVGPYATREQAEAARDALARKGFRGFVL
jgi:cell division septation protein DedD